MTAQETRPHSAQKAYPYALHETVEIRGIAGDSDMTRANRGLSLARCLL